MLVSHYWKAVDLDYILVGGDKLYKSLEVQTYLNADELPKKAEILDSFLTDIFDVSNANTSTGCILFV